MPTTIQELQTKFNIDPSFTDELAGYLANPDIVKYDENNYLEVNGVVCTVWFDDKYNAHISNVNGNDCDIIIDYWPDFSMYLIYTNIKSTIKGALIMKNQLPTGFYLVSKYVDQTDLLPARQTSQAAAYDLKAATDYTIPPFQPGVKPILVPTGVKVKLNSNQVLLCFNRSSNPIKRNLFLANGVGVIDADYFDNETNEGEIFASFYNYGPQNYQIHRGDRIMQGMIVNYETLTNAITRNRPRTGGFGSTDGRKED